ncbi:DIP1984 family protein [Merdimmobilis hominis]|jgi:tRNA C32,U32 (ribose-2'-O)-methylase TrmJ|uniref:Septicolysin n=1 Tax=uncultured Anaerotruncus sp. TaxID=905011 RepID=A0A6N2SXR5_9FIRM|nr:DIP1984 family protein [Merdimmobilis hominis]MCD4836038.1 DIP1984 family protein [Merdimmobilis hominis]PWL62730.1 MAG: hypothetical protein DBY34_02750 [Oscillospiraceae bacterium]
MKLAEALNERADIQRRIAQLESRLIDNAKVQEGEEPAERPEDLLAELDGLFSRLEELMSKINWTNSQTIQEGHTMTQLLARRDCLTRKIGVLRSFLQSASATVSRATRSEIKIKSTVSVAKMQKQVDGLSKELRELDSAIQALNWTTNLME